MIKLTEEQRVRLMEAMPIEWDNDIFLVVPRRASVDRLEAYFEELKMGGGTVSNLNVVKTLLSFDEGRGDLVYAVLPKGMVDPACNGCILLATDTDYPPAVQEKVMEYAHYLGIEEASAAERAWATPGSWGKWKEYLINNPLDCVIDGIGEIISIGWYE